MERVKYLALLSFIALIVNAVETKRENLARIARGQPAAPGQFPYMVSLYVYPPESRGKLCGAVLIGPEWILTAAHCLYEMTAIEAYLGSIFLNDADVAYNVPLTNIVLHPHYNTDESYNDIALLRIQHTELCDNIGTVPLPKIEPVYPSFENEVAIGLGWGSTNSHERVKSDRLLWGRMKILEQKDCRDDYITDEELCTATSADWATICPGDSGGPLVLENTGQLIGIASRGDFGDCENGLPPIFVRVTSYVDWIKSVSGISS